jgi:molybdopterin/thiamine biosynthesis adenylyltransferase
MPIGGQCSAPIDMDRYDPAGTVIQCVDKAERVLQDALSGRLNNDFAAEFGSYWRPQFMMYDLPKDFVGIADIRYPRLHQNDEPMPVLTAGQSWTTDREPGKHTGTAAEQVLVVSIDQALTVSPKGNWPPPNLLELSEWLSWTDPSLVSRLDEALSIGTHVSGTLVIRASNGVYASRVAVPPAMQTAELLRNRRKHLPRVLRQVGSKALVERIRGDAVDLEYVYGRNLGSRKNLVGKSVLLVGCGTIGGFLAQQLAQCGAGIGGGRFVIADTDQLRTSNLGRHLLGVPYLHRNKAQACAEFLNEMLPGAAIEGIEINGLQVPDVDRFDLVIDATGEEALSLALNQRVVDRRPDGPPHIFVWLVGNGAAAQCIFVDGNPETACFKCLKPELSAQPRFRIERPGMKIERGTIAACGDAEFVTFPVSRSMMAASMAGDIALDWANGAIGDRFRSHTMDLSQAFDVKNASPNAHSQCPACQPIQ